eukprot:TRINITY_DN53389_c0_g1_i1.p1 TRINITY_DN53389_c0_g1~~TRINITY_DN53389_c0_g1_i1.p1  ORF type:complete len:904 (+),score=537.75 TRINITY_DN53389_c0_g1_i1:3-2714(+)
MIDVRIVSFECQVSSVSVAPTLEFSSPARSAVVQEIPMVNNTDQDWHLKAQLSGSPYFSGASDFTVSAHSTGSYSLSFRPAWVCNERGVLKMHNVDTEENHLFNLVGVGHEPFAEDHVKLECRAHDELEQVFAVPNPTAEDVEYTIESDMACVSGPSSLTVRAMTTGDYRLRIVPVLSGFQKGSITFMNQATGQFYWYALEIDVSHPKAQATLPVKAFVRKAAGIDIQISNPLSEPVEFDVTLDGEGLIGDSKIRVHPTQSRAYELIFSPLSAGKWRGSVRFVNAQVGEFWYQLLLVGEPPAPTVLPVMECALGSSVQQTVVIDNPTSDEIELTGVSSNSRNFEIKPPSIVLGAYASGEFTVVYTPSDLYDAASGGGAGGGGGGGAARRSARAAASSRHRRRTSARTSMHSLRAIRSAGSSRRLVDGDGASISPGGSRAGSANNSPRDMSSALSLASDKDEVDVLAGAKNVDPTWHNMQKARLHFSDPSFGEVVYIVLGKGLPPPKHQKQTTVSGRVNARTSSLVTFRNPFEYPLPIRVKLDDPSAQFEMYLKKEQRVCTLDAFATMQIAFAFSPDRMREALASIIVESRAEPTLLWRYPLRGLPMGQAQEMVYEFNCAAREQVERVLHLDLAGLVLDTDERGRPLPAEFFHEIKCQDPQYAEFLKRAFDVHIINSTLKRVEPLRVECFFAPMRPVETNADLVLYTRSGALWRFNLHLQATPAPVDGTIRVESNLGVTSVVKFRLKNKYDEYAPFKAMLSPDTPPEFAVYPTSGTLAPASSGDETIFHVSFTPVEYGKISGELIIVSDHMQWSFVVTGTHPKYVVPSAQARLDNRLSPMLMKKLTIGDNDDSNNNNNNNHTVGGGGGGGVGHNNTASTSLSGTRLARGASIASNMSRLTKQSQ